MLKNEKDIITFFRLSRWINYLKKRMKENLISEINFEDIATNFANDPFLITLITQFSFLGIDSKNIYYTHNTSEHIVNLFIKSIMLTNITV